MISEFISSRVSDFRPALRFVGWFVAIYFVGNIIYGLYIEWYRPSPDSMTILVTGQSAAVINHFSPPVSIKALQTEPIVNLSQGERLVLSVFEGCNGLNVMIVFVAFVVAFGGPRYRMILFLLSGLIAIHLVNLLRINLLFYTAIRWPQYFYYFHKYFFTACLYVFVFILWYVWIRWTGKKNVHAPA